jgi:uncharacterized protein YjbI with pentapeptide repeats
MKKKRFIPLLAALALCAGAVVGCRQAPTPALEKAPPAKDVPQETVEPPRKHPEWHLADGTEIDEEWMAKFVVEHWKAVYKQLKAKQSNKGKIEDYRQPLKGAYLPRIDLTLIMAKAEALAPDLYLYSIDFGNLDLSGCILDGAKLEGLRLEDVYLNGASLHGANLSKVSLKNVDLSGADLQESNLMGACFTIVNATEATFRGATLKSAEFNQSRVDRCEFFFVRVENLKFEHVSAVGALFYEVELAGVQFLDTNVDGARFREVDFFEATWEARGKPDLAILAGAEHLETLRFDKSEIGLVELRKAFMEAGIRSAERKVNYALQRARTDRLWNDGLEGWRHDLAIWSPTILERMARIEVGFRKVFFDWTCLYGLDP